MNPHWTEEELAVLRRYYRSHRTAKWSGWAKVLPGRSTSAIMRKATDLRLTKRKRCASRAWTDEESAELLRFLVEKSRAWERTPTAIALRAEYLCQKARGMVEMAKKSEGRIQ